jgi:hypothetical protein
VRVSRIAWSNYRRIPDAQLSLGERLMLVRQNRALPIVAVGSSGGRRTRDRIAFMPPSA